VARVLLEGGFVTPEQVERARAVAREKGKGLLDTLVNQGVITRETLTTVLSFQLRIPVVDLKHVKVDPEAVALVPEDLAREKGILPVGFDADGSLRIATKMPTDFALSSELSARTGRQVKFVLALGEGLEELIDRTYASLGMRRAPPPKPAPEEAPPAGLPAPTPEAPTEVLGVELGQLPAVQAVEVVTLQAVKRRASDVHLVPTPDSGEVLFRVDGVLQQVAVLPLSLHEGMISRIKVMANMDVTERRRPQDGSFSLQFGDRKVDFRVATIGTVWGEMMVIRVLDRSGGLMSLEDLGLEAGPVTAWRQLLALPYGMVLVSGPTGSGKTTTLYASVIELVRERGNIMTIEDPVEYRIEGLNQIEVNRAAGIDFPTGLRAIMRLDPDVILVGEIRDQETARTAVDAALTGHLVLASIHANDAASSLVRLLDLGIEPYLVATAMVGALSQRLVRKICPHCKVEVEPSATEALAYEQELQEPVERLWVGQGCNFCNGTGYLGRTGVFEVLVVDEEIRTLIVTRASSHAVRAQAIAKGMIPLRRAGMLKAKGGVTTVGEVLRKVFFIE